MTAEFAPHETGWRILVVDDSVVVRAAVRAMLAALPEVAVIETAGSASAALAILARHAETTPIDVVPLDVEMASMTGIEALPYLLRAAPTSRIVMASSLTQKGAAVTMTALAAGASDYPGKPQASAAEARQAYAAALATKIAIWVPMHGHAGRRASGRHTTQAGRPPAARTERPNSLSNKLEGSLRMTGNRCPRADRGSGSDRSRPSPSAARPAAHRHCCSCLERCRARLPARSSSPST